MAYTLNRVELVETSAFTRQITGLLSAEEYRRFQAELVASRWSVDSWRGRHPEGRVAVGSRGKSGGARVIYYWAVRKQTQELVRVVKRSVWT